MSPNPTKRPSLPRAAFLGLLAAASLLASACSRDDEIIEFDQRFSLNIVRVPDWFPGKKNALTPPQEEVFLRRGAPQFIRFWWRPEGDIVTSSDFSGKRDDLPKMLQTAKQTWIYWSTGKKEEIEFLSGGGYDVHPLTEQIDLLCRYGDPTQRNPPKVRADGKRHESWTWVDHGVSIEFVDGKVANRQDFKATGQGTDLMK